MNQRLGKWQMGVGVIIILLGLLAIFIQTVIAICVILYGVYVVYVGSEIKKGRSSVQKDKDLKS